MRFRTLCTHLTLGTAVMLAAVSAQAAEFPQPQEGDWAVSDFRFHDGSTLPELKLHYLTLGNPSGDAVLVLHGSSGSGRGMLSQAYAGELFGAGQPLDATTHYIILPDAIGAGKSSKPSDGLRMKFPKYTYDDMVRAQYRLVSEHLGVRHLKLVTGTSMGGMHTWMWGEMYPDFMDALVPMSSLPSDVAGRNWMMRRMLIEAIKADPAWNGGNYTEEPPTLKYINTFFSVAFGGGNQGLYKIAPTHAKADQYITSRLAAKFTVDANNVIYAYDAARDYNPEPDLEKITARLLAVNSTDDERNPQELGILERDIKRVKNGSVYMIPGSPDTRGHGTVSSAKLWKHLLPDLLGGPALAGK